MKRLQIFLVFIIATFSLAAEEIAVSTFVSGEVYYIHEGKKSRLKIHQQIFEKDTILTQKGKADIQMGRNSIIRITENSQLVVSKFNENGNESNTNLNIGKGQAYAKIIKPLNKKSSYKITTPTYVAGVRGTEFVVSVEDTNTDKEKKEESIPGGVYVNDGSVSVSSDGKEQIVNEKEQVVQTNKGLQKDILSKYMQGKMEIFKKLDVMKEKNYEMLKEQMMKNKALLDQFKTKRQEM